MQYEYHTLHDSYTLYDQRQLVPGERFIRQRQAKIRQSRASLARERAVERLQFLKATWIARGGKSGNARVRFLTKGCQVARVARGPDTLDEAVSTITAYTAGRTDEAALWACHRPGFVATRLLPEAEATRNVTFNSLARGWIDARHDVTKYAARNHTSDNAFDEIFIPLKVEGHQTHCQRDATKE